MIVAIGGGDLAGGQTSVIDGFLSGASGRPSPRVLFLPTASRDAAAYIETVTGYFSRGWGCEVRGLTLTSNPSPRSIAAAVDWAEVVYVGGGDTNFLIKTWNRLGVGPLLASAHDRGCVLAGISAGAICWFEGGIGAYNGYRPLPGLGLAPGVVLPHFTPAETEALSPWLASHPGQDLWGIGDRAALAWDGGNFQVIRDTPDAGVWKVSAAGAEPL